MIRRTLPWIAIVVGLLIVWLTLGRRIALVVDRVRTVEDHNLPIDSMTYSSGALRIGEAILLTDSDLAVRWDEHERLVMSTGGRDFLLAREPGDTVAFTLSHGLSWPTPFDFNFMTGHSPSWKRHRYYRLLWTKANGSKLDLLWRYEQWFYDGLGGWSGDMNGLNPTGLVSKEIR
jgi:hypothetical protein